MKSLIIARNEILDKYLKDVEPLLQDLRAKINEHEFTKSQKVLDVIRGLSFNYKMDVKRIEEVIENQSSRNNKNEDTNE